MTILLIIVAMVAALRLTGRRWWCKCGSWIPWSFQVTGPHNSNHFFDPYSATHLQHGLGWYLLAWALGVPPADRLAAAVAAEALFEIVENSKWAIERYRRVTISIGYEGDAILNSVGDILCCLLGAWLGSMAPVALTTCLAGAIELLLLVTIRDSLGLNIVMLVYPIEAVRRWQNS